MGCLHRLSLIDYTPDVPAQAVRVHQLIQRTVREQVPDDRAHALARVAGDALLEAWPEIERDTALAQALRANTDILYARAPLWELDGHEILFRAGSSRGNAGLTAAAVEHFRHLVAAATHHLGPDHPVTLTARNHLARWRGEAGDPAGAVTAFEELLPDLLRVLGSNHPHTLIVRGHLARWLWGARN